MPGAEETIGWRPTRQAKYGVVVYPYLNSKPYPYLKLYFGDVVQILEENGGWFRGFSLREKHSKGIFPASHIRLKDCTVENPGAEEVVIPKEDPMVQEIADVLREWSLLWKKLYAEGKRRQFQDITQLMRELLDRRRQIMSKSLPRDELKELKQIVGAKIDYGNRILSLDIVPRDDGGTAINPKTAGVMQLYKQVKTCSQTFTNDRAAGNRQSYLGGVQSPSSSKREEHHLVLKFEALALPINEPAEIIFFLYDARMSRTLSERYLIALSQHCLPKNPDKIGQCYSLFTDLDVADLNNKELYLVCQVVRVGHDLDGKRTATPVRKPHGVGVYAVNPLLNPPIDEEKDIQMEIFTCNPSDYCRLQDMIIKKQQGAIPGEKGTGVFISLRVLTGPLSKVKEENPLLFRTKYTAECHKLGFPEVIRPSDVRHDVYLTLMRGQYSRGTKRADKNVCVDVEVVDDEGKLIENCIVAGIGEEPVTVYSSLVIYHFANPCFNEIIKLRIAPDMMKRAKVKFSFYHRTTITTSKISKSDPFAFSQLTLMKEDDTTIEDGEHELYVYTYKELKKVQNLSPIPTVVDASANPPPQDFLSPKDNFFVRTQICSTKLTQNAALHALLHWRQVKDTAIPKILTDVIKVPGDEIVKFLADTFNALFAIMEEHVNLCGDFVFEALVVMISLLAVEKYENFRPVLDAYCDRLFKAATVHLHLVTKMKEVFEQVMLVDGTRKMKQDTIQKTSKAAEFLFKFIMRSRTLYEQSTRGKGNEAFKQSVVDLLHTASSMLKVECPENELITPRVQAQTLQSFPQTIPLFLPVMGFKAMGEVVAEFLFNMKEAKLRIYKSVFVTAVIGSELFKHSDSRVIILPAVLKHLRYHIIQRDDQQEKSLESLGSILVLLHDMYQDATVDQEVNLVVKEMLQVLLEYFNSMVRVSKTDKQPSTLGLCVSVLMGLFELMQPKHYKELRQNLTTASKLEEFIECTFSVFTELLSLTVYPPDWNILRLQQNYVTLRMTNQISQILVEDFLGNGNSESSDMIFFNPNLWESFFHLAVAFTCQDSLQLEGMNEVRRNKVMDSYGDMRVAMNALMVAKWKSLGLYQPRYVPSMVGPFLQVSLVPHQAIRKTTIPLFFDMMENELKYRKNLHLMETEMIDKLDVFISGGMGDASYRHVLHHMLVERCKNHPNPDVKRDGLVFIESLAELLRRLLDYRAVHQGDEYRDVQMHVMFNLLNFYKNIGREEIYIRYIYRLAQLHRASGNFVEASFTLLLHAGLLQWTSQMQKQEGEYKSQTSSERKEALYHDIIDYFDKGKLWECGIEQCREVIKQHETVTCDYAKLSAIHQTISQFYSNILKEIRAEPEYFRVGFYGSFPSFLKNKVFIFRGQEYEKLADFNTRLSSQFPSAKLMKTLETPGLDILESTEQYIQSCSVDPIPEKETMSKFDGKRVAEQITRFYHTNLVKRFLLKRPFHKGKKDKENEYKTLHVECTEYTTEHRFPGILRWFEVKDTDVHILNPVQNGTDLVTDNIIQLRVLINRVKVDPNQSTSPLTMKLNGTLDAAVNGGVSKFENFFTEEFLAEYPDCRQQLPGLKQCMEDLGKVLEEGVQLHSRVCPDSMRALHNRMEGLLEDYLSNYGNQNSIGSHDYDPTAASPSEPPASPEKRRLSSSRRKTSGQSATSERTATFTSPRPSSVMEDSQSDDQRIRASTVFSTSMSPSVSCDLQEPPKVPAKKKLTNAGIPGTPPSIPPHRQATVVLEDEPLSLPPSSPASMMRQSSSSSALEGESRPPPPPRSTSVRHRMSGSFGSKESIDSLGTPSQQDGGTPVMQRRELTDSPSTSSVRDLISKISTASEQKQDTPPLPISRRARQPAVQLKDGPPTDSSSS